jgi:hypothetical protein
MQATKRAHKQFNPYFMGVSTATEMKQIGKIENGVHSLVVG